MTAPAALKTGLVGYLYRWIRNAGIVAFLSGTIMLLHSVHGEVVNQSAIASVSRIEIACEITGAGWLNSTFVRDVECSDVAAVLAANSQLVLTSREVSYAHLSYRTQAGEEHTARARSDAFEGAMRRGDEVEIAYRSNDPASVWPNTGSSAWIRAVGMMLGGLIALLFVLAVRRAACFESNVADEIVELKRAHEARARIKSRF